MTCTAMDLKPRVLDQLRHARAAAGLTQKRRTIESTQASDIWHALATLGRYAKAGQLQRARLNLPPRTRHPTLFAQSLLGQRLTGQQATPNRFVRTLPGHNGRLRQELMTAMATSKCRVSGHTAVHRRRPARRCIEACVGTGNISKAAASQGIVAPYFDILRAPSEDAFLPWLA